MKTPFFFKWSLYLVFLTQLLHTSRAQVAGPYDILINEFLPDPTPSIGLPNAEFIELYNRTTRTFNLKDYRLYNGSVFVELPSFLLKPNAFVIIYTKKSGVDFGLFGDTLALPRSISLSNPNDTFHLVNPQGTVIDAAFYDLSFYQNSQKANGGWSLERTQTDNVCTPFSWTASVDLTGGTPGRRNSTAQTGGGLPLSLEQAYFKDEKNVILVFNQALDRFLAQDTSLFQWSDGLKTRQVTALAPVYNRLQLSLNAPILPNKIYTLTVQPKLKTCNGQNLGQPDTLLWALPKTPTRGDVVINEILVNPVTGGSRFIELYNNSDKILDMSKLWLSDPSRGQTMPIQQAFLLFPKKYCVITPDPIFIKKQYRTEGGARALLKNSVPTWQTAAGTALLYTIVGTRVVVLDSVAYTDDFHSPFLTRTEGVSLERLNPSKVSEKSNWHSAAAAVGFATPTYQNSQYVDTSQTAQSTFLQAHQLSFSPDDDGEADVLTLTYNFDQGGYWVHIRIFSENGTWIATLQEPSVLTAEGTLKWAGDTRWRTRAPQGLYIIVADFISPDQKRYREKYAIALNLRP